MLRRFLKPKRTCVASKKLQTFIFFLLLFWIFVAQMASIAQDEVPTVGTPAPEFIMSVSWSPTNSHIAAGIGPEYCNSEANDYSIRLFDPTTLIMVDSLDRWDYCTAHILDWSPDGKLLLAGGVALPLIVWDIQTGYGISGFPITTMWGFSQSFWDPDGHAIAAIERYGSQIMIWDPFTGERLFTIGDVAPDAITWSPDGTRLAATLQGGVVIDVVSGEIVLHLDTDLVGAIA